MSQSPAIPFAKFMQNHKYTTTMWEGGVLPSTTNDVCHAMTVWLQESLGASGEFITVWSHLDDVTFSGDNELAYVTSQGQAFLLPSPYIEGDAEGFIQCLRRILDEDFTSLFATTIGRRILYNAV